MTDPNAPQDPAFTPSAPDFGAATSATPPSAPPVPSYVQDAAGSAPASAKTNVLAIVSLVASLVGLVTGLGFLAGIITGHIALSQIKKTHEQGRGMALAGTIIGWVGTALSILTIIIFVIAFAAVMASHPSLNSTY